MQSYDPNDPKIHYLKNKKKESFMKQIFEGVVGSINTLKIFTTSLITRVKTINNDMIKLDTSVSSALDLTPDLDRIARAENFVEDGTIDVRRD